MPFYHRYFPLAVTCGLLRPTDEQREQDRIRRVRRYVSPVPKSAYTELQAEALRTVLERGFCSAALSTFLCHFAVGPLGAPPAESGPEVLELRRTITNET